MNITPFLFWPVEIPPIREHSITQNTLRIRLVRGERSLERNSHGSRPWAGGQNRRVRIPQRKAQCEGDDLAQIGDNSKNRRWTSKTVGRRSGSENIHLDRGSEYPHRGEVQEDLLGEWGQVSTNQQSKKSLHINTVYTEISDIVTKIASKNMWENLSWISSTSRLTPSITGKTNCYSGSRFINEFFLKLALFNIHDTFKTGNWSSYVFLKFVYLTNHDIFNCVKRQCG